MDKLTQQEKDTILAALRAWQAGRLRPEHFEMAAEHGNPLADEDIDDLCERINCS